MAALHARVAARLGATPDHEVKPAAASSAPLSDNDQALLALARRASNGARFSALWNGDTSAHGDDDSAADLALCGHLAFWTGHDPARMDRLFRASGLMRGKWDERRGASSYGQRTIATALARTRKESTDPDADDEPAVTLADFRAYMPMHKYLYIPARDVWPGASVNARIPPIQIGLDEKGEPRYQSASAWLDQHQPVEQMTWAPGEPLLIRDRLIAEGDSTPHPGVTVFNLYRAPAAIPGDAANADPWLDHVRDLYPEDVEHILDWLAHRVQRPAEKINHALVLGGDQGIGKDTLLEPVRRAVGSWNFGDVAPGAVMGRFNDFLKSVILRISEARDLGEVNRYAFYDHMKTISSRRRRCSASMKSTCTSTGSPTWSASSSRRTTGPRPLPARQ